jgi:hypothetical protein
MKAVNAKMVISLVGVMLIVPFFVVVLMVEARAAALAGGAQSDLFLVALALGGAACSMINGFGRRTGKALRGAQHRVEARGSVAATVASMISARN